MFSWATTTNVHPIALTFLILQVPDSIHAYKHLNNHEALWDVRQLHGLSYGFDKLGHEPRCCPYERKGGQWDLWSSDRYRALVSNIRPYTKQRINVGSYYDQWPIGLAVSSSGRIFTDYTRGSYPYTLGEVVNQTAEKPYPSLELQVPVSDLGNKTSGVNFATNNSTAFISVQALIITSKTDSRPETLWVLDTGTGSDF